MADKYGITEHIEFSKTVDTTVWNEENDEWIVTLDDGEVSKLISASRIPKTWEPTIEGSPKFQILGL